LYLSEYQLFCNLKDKQNPFQVFNTQVTEEVWKEINIPTIRLEIDYTENETTRYQTAFKKAWQNLSQEEKQEFYDIPHFDWDIFTKITGIKKD